MGNIFVGQKCKRMKERSKHQQQQRGKYDMSNSSSKTFRQQKQHHKHCVMKWRSIFPAVTKWFVCLLSGCVVGTIKKKTKRAKISNNFWNFFSCTHVLVQRQAGRLYDAMFEYSACRNRFLQIKTSSSSLKFKVHSIVLTAKRCSSYIILHFTVTYKISCNPHAYAWCGTHACDECVFMNNPRAPVAN